MSKVEQFQNAQQVQLFMGELQGMLKDPRLANLAKAADDAKGTAMAKEIEDLAGMFGQLAGNFGS